MFWKTVKYVLLLILVGSLAVSVYGWLDTAMALDDARSQEKINAETSELLRQFLVASNHGAKRNEIMQFVQRNFAKDHIIKEEQNKILVDNVVFRFDDAQSLKDIQFLDKLSE